MYENPIKEISCGKINSKSSNHQALDYWKTDWNFITIIENSSSVAELNQSSNSLSDRFGDLFVVPQLESI